MLTSKENQQQLAKLSITSMTSLKNDGDAWPPIDTNGGTITDYDEREEIDPIDGCKVLVSTYRILSADKSEEITRTLRKKLRVNVTQEKRQIHSVFDHVGNEEKVSQKSERTVFIGDMGAMKQQPSSTIGRIDNGVQDAAIERVFARTHETFARLFNEQKNEFIQMFPNLFKEMRTQPTLFTLPSTATEVVVNPDGSRTTRSTSSRAYSSHFSKTETFINGVMQESKVRTRAFMEYHGPDGGFRVKLTDGDGDEVSEDDDDDDRQSIAYSELPDNTSALVLSQPSGIPRIGSSAKVKKRLDKAWHAAKELVDSEERYVIKLRLLDEHFRERIEHEHLLDKEHASRLFANINSLYRFHSDHLMPQLLERSRDWHQTHKISDIMRKQAPFLKMYSEYTNNYKRATKEYDMWMKKSKRFAQIVQEIEHLPECDNLPLSSHLICPVQRVMRYQLLLQEYLKHLNETDADYDDAKAALELVLEAAGHANEMMRKLDRYRNVLEVQELLGNTVPLVSPSRELVKQGSITKISSKTNKSEERQLFLFNDMLLLCSSRIAFAKYRLRAAFDASLMQIFEGDNLEYENSFYIRGSDSESGPARCVELYTDTQARKKEWMDALWTIINDAATRRQSFSTESIVLSKTEADAQQQLTGNNQCCQRCSTTFNWLNKSTKCDRCSTIVCKRCLRKTKDNNKTIRVCEKCWNSESKGIELPTATQTNRNSNNTRKRLNLLGVSAIGDGVVYSGHCFVRSTAANSKETKRYLSIRQDFCLYSFKTENDTCALAMLPLPGCEIKEDDKALCFRIKHQNRQYIIKVKTEVEQAKWMAVLELASNAALPHT